MRRRTPEVVALVLLAIGLVAIGLGLTGCRAGSHERGAPPMSLEPATVVEVIDGDTIKVDGGHGSLTVRLIGIDTPETKRPNTPVECFGEQAHAQLTRLLPAGTNVGLEHDAEPQDRYQRDLAYVYREVDGLFVNLAMVADGYAGVLTFAPNTRHEAAFDDAGDEARLTRRGLWGACGANHRVARGVAKAGQ